MSVLSRPRLVAGAACLLVLAGCGAAEKPTLDERIEDLDAAVEVYRTVDGAECDEPGEERESGTTVAVDCEDGATIVWDSEDTSEESQRELTSAILHDDHGIDAVVGVNVTIMNVDPAAVAEQIGGSHP